MHTIIAGVIVVDAEVGELFPFAILARNQFFLELGNLLRVRTSDLEFKQEPYIHAMGVNFIMLDSRCDLAPAAKVPGPKHISNLQILLACKQF